MKKSKIQISAHMLDAIVQSKVMRDSEKLLFLKYVGYMTQKEQNELLALV